MIYNDIHATSHAAIADNAAHTPDVSSMPAPRSGKRHRIELGSHVVVLFGKHLVHGVATKLNLTTIKVTIPAERIWREYSTNFDRGSVANVNDVLSVVYEPNKGMEGAYRFDYETYPQHNGPISKWSDSSSYVKEEKKKARASVSTLVRLVGTAPVARRRAHA